MLTLSSFIMHTLTTVSEKDIRVVLVLTRLLTMRLCFQCLVRRLWQREGQRSLPMQRQHMVWLILGSCLHEYDLLNIFSPAGSSAQTSGCLRGQRKD